MARQFDFGITVEVNPEMRLQELRAWARRFQVRSDVGGWDRRTKVDMVADIRRAMQSPWVQLYQMRVAHEEKVHEEEASGFADILWRFAEGAATILRARETASRGALVGHEARKRASIVVAFDEGLQRLSLEEREASARRSLAELIEADHLELRKRAIVAREACVRDALVGEESREAATILTSLDEVRRRAALEERAADEHRSLVTVFVSLLRRQKPRAVTHAECKHVTDDEEIDRATVTRKFNREREQLYTQFMQVKGEDLVRSRAMRYRSNLDDFTWLSRCRSNVMEGVLQYEGEWRATEDVRVATIGGQHKNNALDEEIIRLQRRHSGTFIGVTEVCKPVFQRLRSEAVPCNDTPHVPGHFRNVSVSPHRLGPWVLHSETHLPYTIWENGIYKTYYIGVRVYRHRLTGQRFIHGTAHVAWAKKHITPAHFSRLSDAMAAFSSRHGAEWIISIDGNFAACGSRVYDPTVFHDCILNGEPYLGTASSLDRVNCGVDRSSAFLKDKRNTDHPNVVHAKYRFNLCGTIRVG